MCSSATGTRPVSVWRYAGLRMPESVPSANMPQFSRFFLHQTFHLSYFEIDPLGVMNIEVILIVESGRRNVITQRAVS
jgi:hypothetical protein